MSIISLPGQTDWLTVLIIIGLTLVTIVSRSFFFILQRDLPMPTWFQRSLKYAPVAALAALVIPEVVVAQGEAGKPRRLLSYIGGVGAYRQRCAEVAAGGYAGFALR